MMDEKTKNRNVFLPAEAGALVDDDIYFFSSEYNLLYKIHMPDFAVSVVSHIPCEKALAVKWFRKMRYWKEMDIRFKEREMDGYCYRSSADYLEILGNRRL